MRYIFIITTVLVSLASNAQQLTAPGSNAERVAVYPSAPGVNDPVFIYCNSLGSVKGALNTSSPAGPGPFNYSWNKWSDITKSFSIPLPPGTEDTPSSRNNLDEGGYKVRITDGGIYDTSLIGWIYLDKPYSEANLSFRDCDRVILYGKAITDTFYYNDIWSGTGAYVRLNNTIGLTWSSTPASVILPIFPPAQYPNLYRPTKLPYDDITYKINAVDDFGCGSEASFSYQSIHVKADYSLNPNKGEAPLEVSFTDKSIRALNYIWDFGDGTKSLTAIPGSHLYYKPGTYYPKLFVESSLTCIDSVRLDSVVVEPSKLSIPNVFTPDGDGINDYFIPDLRSLRTINVEIYSKSGQMVYSFNGLWDSLKEWQGWDGNVNRSSSKASPGVYFYIIRAKGWDDKIYDSKEYRGFLYLYR